ncbi:MAG: YaiI/YqxD family protein [Gammaproteobacteria bacterium]
MNIWVDADACPRVVKDTLFRAAERRQVLVTLVANKPLAKPASAYIRSLCVAGGFDVADNEIVKRLAPGDLVVTSDIPLAAEVLAKGGHALSPRGDLFATDTIRAKLTMRDFMETMRASGIQSDGPAPMNQRDQQTFANHLDRWLQKRTKVPR